MDAQKIEVVLQRVLRPQVILPQLMQLQPHQAQIFLDGGNTGEVTPKAIEVQSGSHIVKLVKVDYGEWSDTIYVAPNQTVQVDVQLTISFNYFCTNWNYTGPEVHKSPSCEKISLWGYGNPPFYIDKVSTLNLSPQLIIPQILAPSISVWVRDPFDIGSNVYLKDMTSQHLLPKV